MPDTSELSNVRFLDATGAGLQMANRTVSRAIDKAVIRQVKLEKSSIVAAVRAIAQSGTAYPYATLVDWIVSRRLAAIVAKNGGITPDQARAIIAQRSEKASAEIQVQIDKLFKLSQWDQWSKTALEAGLIAAGIGAGVGGGIALAAVGIGAAAGSAVPVFGTLIGAAVGFIVGVCTAIFPVEKWKVLDNFAGLVRSMKPIDRMLLWASCRRVMDAARRLEKREPLPEWWMKTPEFYTIWGGVDSVAVFIFEELGRSDCWVVTGAPSAIEPENVNTWDLGALYGCACLASHGASNELFRDTLLWRASVNEGKGTPALRPFLQAIGHWKVETVRAAAQARGLKDFVDFPVTDEVLAAISAREQELSGVVQ